MYETHLAAMGLLNVFNLTHDHDKKVHWRIYLFFIRDHDVILIDNSFLYLSAFCTAPTSFMFCRYRIEITKVNVLG